MTEPPFLAKLCFLTSLYPAPTYRADVLKSALSPQNYSYRATPATPLDRLLSPLWEFTAGLFGPSIAPNVITLIGCGCHVLGLLVLLISAGAAESESGCKNVLAVVLFFVGSTLDAADGKHARRLACSTPVGELLDHSLDAVSSFCLVGSVALRMQTLVSSNSPGDISVSWWFDCWLNSSVMFTLFALISLRAGISTTTAVTEIQWMVYAMLAIPAEVLFSYVGNLTFWLCATIAVDAAMLVAGCAALSLMSDALFPSKQPQWRSNFVLPLSIHTLSVGAVIYLSGPRMSSVRCKFLMATTFALLNGTYCFRLNVVKVTKFAVSMAFPEVWITPLVACITICCFFFSAVEALNTQALYLIFLAVMIYYVGVLTEGIARLCQLQGCGFLEVKARA